MKFRTLQSRCMRCNEPDTTVYLIADFTLWCSDCILELPAHRIKALTLLNELRPPKLNGTSESSFPYALCDQCGYPLDPEDAAAGMRYCPDCVYDGHGVNEPRDGHINHVDVIDYLLRPANEWPEELRALFGTSTGEDASETA